LRSNKPAGLSMNEGQRVPAGGCPWARMRNSAATCVAAELLRAEGQLETLAAGDHADVIVLDGDPLEDIGLLADPAAHIALVIQAVPSSGSADTWSVQLPRTSSGIRVIISANHPEKLAKITRISPGYERPCSSRKSDPNARRSADACALGAPPVRATKRDRLQAQRNARSPATCCLALS
jgi:hypothetical protein